MNFGAILDNVLLDRFPTTVRPRAKIAVNLRYAQLWTMEDWTFKYQTANPATAAGNVSLQGLPTDFGVAVKLWDENGDPLQYLTVIDFYTRYLPVMSGTPEAYTVDAQDIRLGPTPSRAATWTLYYRKRLTQLVDETADSPALPAEFHSILIDGGRAALKAAYNDPTSGDDEQNWQASLDAMRRDYLTDVEGEPSMWGSDPSWGGGPAYASMARGW